MFVHSHIVHYISNTWCNKKVIDITFNEYIVLNSNDVKIMITYCSMLYFYEVCSVNWKPLYSIRPVNLPYSFIFSVNKIRYQVTTNMYYKSYLSDILIIFITYCARVMWATNCFNFSRHNWLTAMLSRTILEAKNVRKIMYALLYPRITQAVVTK